MDLGSQRPTADRIDRRTLLGALGSGVGLSGLSGLASASPSTGGDVPAGTRTPTGVELARARVHGNGFGPLTSNSECFRPNQREIYGPTDMSAASANGRLAVGVNREGTVTVFRWPRPSFYDQLRYFTRGRDADDEIVVAPNHGAFLGVATRTGDDAGFETTWLRDWTVESHRFANDAGVTDAEYSDEIVTRYAHEDLGLAVTVRDVTTHSGPTGQFSGDLDTFVRRVSVDRRPGSPVTEAKLIAFANLSLVVEKFPQYPVQDWCLEEDNQQEARYELAHDAIVNASAGIDPSTGTRSSVAIAMGFDGDSVGHQVGGDAYMPGAEPTGEAGPTRDAYDDASTGSLSGNDRYVGQATSAIATALSFDDGGTATETLALAAGEDDLAATTILGHVRETQFEALRRNKEAWIADLLADAPLPNRGKIVAREDHETADTILAAVRRALVYLVTTYDPTSGAVVGSISTQPPYGVEFPRAQGWFNRIFHVIGREEWVADRNRWHAAIQQHTAQSASDGDVPGVLQPSQVTSLNTPPGNWNMAYYADGVAGGPIPFQTDTTGLMVWAIWDHYAATGDEDYLADVYPAIRRAAEFLVECRDPRNGLQCPTFEDDRPFQPDRQTVNGAIPVWLALRSASRAAEALGRTGEADRYAARQHELGRAIDRDLYDEDTGAYGTARAGFPYSETVWPARFTPYADPETGEIQDRPVVTNPLEHRRIRSHLATDAASIEPSFQEPEAAELDTGQYEAKALLALGKSSYGLAGEHRDLVREGVAWMATEFATPDTHVLGESWKVFDGADGTREVRSIMAPPHQWEQALLYMSALEAYPPIGQGKIDDDSIDGVLGALQSMQLDEP